MIAILATMIFVGAASAAIGTIAVTIVPQHDRILRIIAQGLAAQ